ncbi:MAG: hypothetical protein QOF89_3793 [Acidobacteriota bacterium]|jgi:hypothetical protein|nr:hypothetical protein [Acidobacteriota bacterium]
MTLSRLTQLVLTGVVGFVIGIPVGLGTDSSTLQKFFRTRDWPTTAQALSNTAQIAALLVAGWWTYSLFIRQRQNQTRANIEHQVTTLTDVCGCKTVRVRIDVENVGTVAIVPPRGFTAVFQVRPVTEPLQQILSPEAAQIAVGSLVLTRPAKLKWPELARSNYKLGIREFLLEPGESEALYCDFCLPASIEAVLVRTQIICGDRNDPEQYWQEESFHPLSLEVATTTAKSIALAGGPDS